MADINLDVNYLEHIKTKRLISRLGKGSEMIPIRLWLFMAKMPTCAGVMVNYTPSEWRMASGWHGDVPKLLLALTEVGFLDKLGDNHYKLHQWEEHQGHLIAYSIRGKKAAKARWKNIEIGKQYAEQRRNDPPKGVNSTPF